jgi:hypothetical protein
MGGAGFGSRCSGFIDACSAALTWPGISLRLKETEVKTFVVAAWIEAGVLLKRTLFLAIQMV